jgi:hypothetical protein
MKKRGAHRGRPALDVVEEAVHLLRQTPARLLFAYYLGAIPFVLGFLYFWADMSVGAFAVRHCPVSALGLAGLFLWMKCWQTVFVSGLRARIAARPEAAWDFRRTLRVLAVQGVLQPSKLFLLPVALAATLPFAWVLAFYENVTALGDGSDASVRKVFRRAAKQAWLWPGQNHLLVGLLGLLGGVVWLNTLIAVAAAPFLLKMLLGIETAFTRAGALSILNSTCFAATVALAFLALDPLVKAIYALRCFHGEARHDGADLLADLAIVQRKTKTLALAAVILFALLPVKSFAEATPVPAPLPAKVESPATISPTELDDAVKRTLTKDKYSWRLPREETAEADNANQSWLQAFVQSIVDTLAKWARGLRDVIRKVVEWMDKIFWRSKPTAERAAGSGTDWMLVLRGFAYLLLVLAAAALVILLYRLGRQGWRRTGVVRAEIIPARPDLTDENVLANQLPEDGWLALARELMDKGELRLALRALYLASLAHLAQREFVSIARFKSNRDYEQEVIRRTRAQPELRLAFSENVAVFDRTWYGLHEVTRDALQIFQGNLDRIRAC